MTGTFGVGGYEWWKYCIMPFMSGLVGWFTNILALQMTFLPIEFKGVELFRMKDQPWGLFGWQGIIPTKAGKMARITTQVMTTKLFKIDEIFNRLKPEEFYEAMKDGLILLIDEIMDSVGKEYIPSTWYYLPTNVKNEIILTANNECPTFLTGFIADMQRNIHNVLDIEEMCVTACLKDKRLVNQVFLECGHKEFEFIRRSGLYFGFIFGCFQVLIFTFYNEKWVLPVFGFIVGWLTNFVALKIIFRPLQPHKVCHKNFQGLFLQRQQDVSATFARINCVELMNTEKMWAEILHGPNHKNFEVLLRAHSIVFTEKLIGGLRPIALAALGAEKFAMMKEDIASQIIEKVPNIIDLSYDYTTKALDLENTIRERMQGLSPEEFEGVLHPAFEEDELTLIFVGGVLGLLVGAIQMFMF